MSMNTESQKSKKPATFKENLREAEAQSGPTGMELLIQKQRQRAESVASPAALAAHKRKLRAEIGNV